MELIGQYLKSQRIEKKYTSQEISKELNISNDILISIENDNLPRFVNKVYLIGHIRSYAKFLNLNVDRVVEDFKAKNFHNESSLENEISKPINYNILIDFYKPVSYGSALLVAFGFYFLFLKPSSLEIEYAITPDVPEFLSSDLEEIEMNLSLSNKSQNKITNIDSPLSFFLEKDKEFNINSSSAVASLPNNNSSNFDNIINLKFLNPTWVQLRDIENNIILSKLMDKGDQYSYKSSEKLFLTAGNAGNIIISLDGAVKGKAGKFGEVIDSLIVDYNYKN